MTSGVIYIIPFDAQAAREDGYAKAIKEMSEQLETVTADRDDLLNLLKEVGELTAHYASDAVQPDGVPKAKAIRQLGRPQS